MSAAFRELLCLAAILLLAGCATNGAFDRDLMQRDLMQQPERFVVIAVNNPPGLVAARAGSTLRGYDSMSAYSTTPGAQATLSAIARDYKLSAVAAWPISALQVQCVVFRIPAQAQRDVLLASLNRDGRIKLAQPLQHFATLGARYNDPYFDLQRNLDVMNVVDAHQWSRGEGVSIAIIDTGMDVNHPDLKGRVQRTRNFVDDDARQFARDLHGTKVAGVIAAMPNNGQGIVGVAPQAHLLAFKACWQLESGDEARCNSFTLAKALAAAIDLQAAVVNLSVSGPFDPLLDALLARGVEQGVIFVGATPLDGARDRFPIATRGVLAVEAAEHRTTLDTALPAPGVDILTLTPGRYDFASGPSLATAQVSGIAALLLSQKRALKSNEVSDLLRQSITPDASTNANRESVNACNAIAALQRIAPCRSTNAKSGLDLQAQDRE